MIKIEEVIQIQASRSAVWRHFAAIQTWNEWNHEVVAASWVEGEPWVEGSVFSVEHFTLFGAKRKTEYVVKMLIGERTAVYVSCAHFPFTTTSSVQLSDSLGGCRLEATNSYFGLLSPLMWLLRSRQRSVLRSAMVALKKQVEGPLR